MRPPLSQSQTAPDRPENPPRDREVASGGNAPESNASVLDRFGVDLSRYPAVGDRERFSPMESDRDRNIESALLKSFRDRLLGRIPDPLMMTHIVTTRCNYSCEFCSFADTLNARHRELDLAEIERVYATLGDKLNVIVYSGGETTLRRDLPDIIEAAYRLTPIASAYIISNAWSPETILQMTHRILQRCPALHLTWSLSIEGPREVNNAARFTRKSGWDAFQNTVDALFGLKAIRDRFGYDQLDAQLCTVCTPDNADRLDEWYELVRDVLKPDKWNLNLLRKSVQMGGHELASFEQRRQQGTLEPFEEKYLEIVERVRQDAIAGKLGFLYHTRSPEDGAMKAAVDLISQDQNRRTLLGKSDLFGCQAGNFGAYLGSEGEVSGCEEFANNPDAPKVFGNVRDFDGDFRRVWQSDAAQTYRQAVGKSPECYGCTLESQRNYPSILVSLKTLVRARFLSQKIQLPRA